MLLTLLWMIGFLLSFCLMAIAGRELSGEINTFEILFFRSLFGLFIISFIILSIKKTHYFKSSQMRIHLMRNVFHFLGQTGWFIGLGLLPLAQVFAIEFSVPFWTAIIAFIFLKERLRYYKIVAIFIAFIGVLLIVKPSLTHFESASMIVLSAAIFYAFAHSTTKYLSSTNHPLTILFYMCLIQLPIAAILMLDNWTAPSLLQWLWIVVVALTAISAHFCMIKAMLYSSITTVVTLDFIRLPLIAVLGYFIYQEQFDQLALLGSTLIISAMLLNLKPEKRTQPIIQTSEV